MGSRHEHVPAHEIVIQKPITIIGAITYLSIN